MQHLYLMRHSKAKKSTSGMADHQRPLSKRGKRQAAAMARVLQRWQALEGDIYVSSAVRTRETLEEVTGQLPDLALADQARFEQTLYTFDGEALLAWLKTLPNESGRVLVIGHNPALLDLAHWLCRETPPTLPTGSMLYFTLPETPWSALEQRCAKLMVSFTPEQANHALFRRRAPTPPKPCEDDTTSLIRGLLEHQYLMFRSLEPGVMAGVDTEFLHQYRVNLRRSRAIGEAVLSTAKVPGLKKRLKSLKHRARATSDLRDLDVFLDSLVETPPPLSTRARQALQRWLQGYQREQHKALCQQLSTPDYVKEMQDWQDFVTSKGFSKALCKLSPKRIKAVLDERIASHDNELATLSFNSDDTALHELRKSVKRIRYLADLDPQHHSDLLSELKHRQSLLGDYQDLCTHQAWIDGFSASSRKAPKRKQECDAWRASLEEQKQALREEVMALAPLAH